MGNDVALPPINGQANPSLISAISEIITELNAALNNGIPLSTFQYLMGFATTLRTDITTLQTNVANLMNNTPSPQTQLTLIQASLTNISNTLSSYIASNNTSIANLNALVAGFATSINTLQTNIGSVNLNNLSNQVSTIQTTLNNIVSTLSGFVPNTTLVNNHPLTGNVNVSASDIGLGNVNNTSDLNKPLSLAAQTALAGKINVLSPSISGGTVGAQNQVPIISYNSNGLITSANQVSIVLQPSNVGLGNVQNFDTTQASNVYVQQPIVNSTLPPVIGDSLQTVTGKLQGQLNSKLSSVTGAVLGDIPIFTNTGSLQDSGKKFNDLGTSTNDILSASAVLAVVNGAVTGVVNLRGSYTLVSGVYPSTGGSGSGGLVDKGDMWYIQGSGTLGGQTVSTGDSIIALIDNPGQTQTNWTIISGSLGFTPENVANKTNTSPLTNSSVLYPTTGLVLSSINTAVAGLQPLITPGTDAQYWRGDETWQTLNASAVGLGNVTNDAQLKRSANDYSAFSNKANPVNQDILLLEDSQNGYAKKQVQIGNLPTANVTALLAGYVPTSTMVNGYPLTSSVSLTATDIGLGNVNNTSDASKPLSSANVAALAGKVDKINLTLGNTVGSANTVSQITYNTQGQITSASSIPISITPSQVGLGNIQNIDTTNIANVSIQSPFITQTNQVVSSDNGLLALEKLQGQANLKMNKITSPTLGGIVIESSSGDAVDSGIVFNDLGTTANDILSAEAVNTLISTATGGDLRYIGSFTPTNAFNYPALSAYQGDLWVVTSTGQIGSEMVTGGTIIFALVNNPGSTSMNWAFIQPNLQYTPENVANKATTIVTNSNVQYPTSAAVAAYITSVLSTYTGGLPSGGTTSQYLRGDDTWQTLNSTAVGLGNVTNDAQLKRSANDFTTFPQVTSLNSNDSLLVERTSIAGAKAYIQYQNLLSGVASGYQTIVSGNTTNAIALLNSSGQVISSQALISTDGTFAANSNSLLPTQEAVKTYVGTYASGDIPKESVQAVSVSAISVTPGPSGTLTTTANGALVIDGYTTNVGNSVLLAGQSSASQNGIYTVTSEGTSAPTVLVRRSDYNAASDINPGDMILVLHGTVYSGVIFYQTQTVTTLETSPINFNPIASSSLGSYLQIANNLSELTATAATARSNIGAVSSATTVNSQPLSSNVVLTASSVGAVPSASVGAANGVAPLNSSSQVPVSYLPSAALNGLSFQGTWNANTNSPTITSGVGTTGYFYIVNTAGTTTLGGNSAWDINDWVVFENNQWQRLLGSNPTLEAQALANLTDVLVSSITNGQVLTYNTSASKWENASLPSASLAYVSVWNANTNSPTITSGVGTVGQFYIVGTAGTTSINGISSWNVNDWIIFEGGNWQKLIGSNAVSSVNGNTGAVSITPTSIGAVSSSSIGAINGVAPLNASGIVPNANLPLTATTAPSYQGAWNANTNSPALVSATGTAGQFYIVSTAGTTTLDGNSIWNVSDWVIFENGHWQRLLGSNPLASSTLAGDTDVAITSPSNNQTLSYNSSSSKWVNSGSTIAINSNTTLSGNTNYYVNTSGGSVTVTLPASPTIGTVVNIYDAVASWNVNNLIINPGSATINNISGSLTVTYTMNINLFYQSNGWNMNPLLTQNAIFGPINNYNKLEFNITSFGFYNNGANEVTIPIISTSSQVNKAILNLYQNLYTINNTTNKLVFTLTNTPFFIYYTVFIGNGGSSTGGTNTVRLRCDIGSTSTVLNSGTVSLTPGGTFIDFQSADFMNLLTIAGTYGNPALNYNGSTYTNPDTTLTLNLYVTLQFSVASNQSHLDNSYFQIVMI